MPPKEYRAKKNALQLDLLRLQGKIVEQEVPVLIIFEGMDAAGKGGAIRRLTNNLDPRWVRVLNLSRPSPYDQSYFWMRRYWTRLPRRGHIHIFDDYSWYARMLVEAIEGHVTEEQCRHAAAQIVDLERWLVEDGYCIIKFWPHVSKDEQLQRFERRKSDPLRAWKLTVDDWQNTRMYEQYVEHANRTFALTSAPYAPWYLIPANDKRYARIEIMQKIVTTLERWPALPG
jgi:polyphosphate kinase 2 (PPK2 family)